MEPLTLKDLCSGLPLDPLPLAASRDPSIPHAPVRTPNLNQGETQLALKNALRYFPSNLHQELVQEFEEELKLYGHIYMYRFVPNIKMKAYGIDEYPCKCKQAAAIMLMIMNNLDHSVAQFPHELVTYGGNGQVFSNWAQFWLVMEYLSTMTEEQTLVMYSGHPHGLFPSHCDAPRVVITNGMVIPNYSSKDEYDELFALGVSMYGQMTAGSYCYIGPQGIVHGTTLTILNAGRKYLNTGDLAGKVFLTSGLGGMSGAQAKAAVIAGCIGVIAEVSEEALIKRHNQGWCVEVCKNLGDLMSKIREYKKKKQAVSIGYHGNIVDVWECLVADYKKTKELLVELGSDQTSLHNPFNGGYYPVALSFDESNIMMHRYPGRFKVLVQESLCRQVAAINFLSEHGLSFWDYGNAFLLEASRAGAEVSMSGASSTVFRYPSYVQHIMGDIFSMGFGPFRWVCTSGKPEDLELTDKLAMEVMTRITEESPDMNSHVAEQYQDNIHWIKHAGENRMVVGSQARILYADQQGRVALALAMNEAVRDGRLKGPVVLSRDHHDVSGTDSPFRETSNIYDGSAFCADMAVQNCIGDSFRGATWVALHNGGGVGWGEVTNGGFGMLLDGSLDADRRARMMLNWDVSNGVSRRAWAGNDRAVTAIQQAMKEDSRLRVTLPNYVDEDILK